MAAGRGRVSRKRKRKLKRGTHRKLGVGEKVEVRSIEDGFLGSWHLGTVISWGDLIREVEYDYILSEKGSGKLVEVVSVSPIVDGLIPADDQIVHQLGMIRPSPPPRESGSWPHGQCVDFFYQDAWWEGVMFDCEEGDEERKVYFPELGDEMKAEVDKLRITQDWDEVTEEWKPRGSWIFLEVIDEVEKLNPLLISVKQIWYEVQLKDDFDEHLNQWTSTSKDIWRKLVKEVVHDNTKLTVKHFLSELNSLQIFGEESQMLKFSELAFEAELNLETYFDNSIAPSMEAVCTLDSAAALPLDQDAYHLQLPMDHDVFHHQLPIDQNVSHLQPVEKQLNSEEFAPATEDVQLCGNDDFESIPPSQKEDSSVSPHDFSVLPPPNDDIAGILSGSKSELPTFVNSKLRRRKPPTKKKRFKGKTLVGKPDSHPEANLTKTSKTKKSEDVSQLQPPMDQDVYNLQLPIDQDVSDPQPVEKQFVPEDFAPATEDVQLSSNDDCILSSTKREPLTPANSKPRRGRPPTKKKKFEGQTLVGEPDSIPKANSTKTIKKKKFEDDSHLQLSMDQDVSHLRLPTNQDVSHLQMPTDQDVSHLQQPMDQDVSHLRLCTDQDVSHLPLVEKQIVLEEFAPSMELSGNNDCILSGTKSEPPTFANSKPRRGRPPTKKKKFDGQTRVGETDSCAEANLTKTRKKKKFEDDSHLQLSMDQDVSHLPPVEKQIVSEYFAPATADVQLSGILSSNKSEPPTFVNSKPRRGRPPTKKKKLEGQTRVGEPDSCAEAKTIKKKKFEDDSHLQLSQGVSQPMDQDVSHLRLPMNQDASHLQPPMDLDVSHLRLPMDQDVFHLPPVEKQIVSEDFAPATEDVQLSGNDDCRSIPPSQKEDSSVLPHDFSVLPPASDDISGILSSTKNQQLTIANAKPCRARPPTKKKKLEGQIGVGQPDSCPEATPIKEFEKPPSDDIAGILSNSKSEQPTFVNSKSCREGLPTEKNKFDWQSLAGEPDSCSEVITKCMPSMSSKKNFKKHLLCTGWKFELQMENGKIKKNYIAPNGSLCKSLSEVCQVLEESKICRVVPPVEQSSLHSGTDNSTKSPCMEGPTCSEVPDETRIEPDETRIEHEETRIEHEETSIEPEETRSEPEERSIEPEQTSIAPEESRIDPEESRIDPEETRIEPEESRIDPEESRIDPDETRIEPEETRIEPEVTMIEPEMCRQAVIDYCLPKSQDTSAYQKSYRHGVKIGATSLKAKKHLAATGWKFYPVGKNQKRYRYCSPEGKSFVSFRKACKWCVKKWEAESHLSEQVSAPSTATRNSCEGSPVEIPLVSLLRESRKKRKHGDVKSRPSLKKADGDMRSRKRAREVAPSSSNQTPRTVLSWLIDNNVVLPRTKVKYCGRKNGNPMAEGRITREGIKCNCCQKIFGLGNFEVHAGSSCNRPSANIYFEDGRSLLECQMQMKSKQSVENKEDSHFTSNDYICSVCHYGGDLVLCDGCPSSFHLDCLGIKELPDGDWFCPSCCCKVCGESRFVKNRNQFTDNTGLICCQCNHKYHVRCMRGKGPGKLDNFPEGNWFCNKRCELIFLGMHHLLEKSVIVGNDNLTWTLLKYIEPDDDESSAEIYCRLCVALNVMHECFEPVNEQLTGRDIVEDVIFNRWSELNRLNFQGFYTVLLERNDELISVAAVRVYGAKVAEIPLVATQFQHRRLGMCRILMNELEKKLTELGVERLVLPAVPGVLNTWTTSFGFSVVEKSERANFLDYTFLDFQGTIMCQKILKKTPAKAQQTHVDNTKSKDNVESDDNVAVSEVFQATQLEGTVDQGYVGYVSSLFCSALKGLKKRLIRA